jgi:phosphate transport system protein
MAPYSRFALDIDLAHQREDLLRLGSLAELQVTRATRALRDRDGANARRVREANLQSIVLCARLERAGLEAIATQQPTARDLRLILATMHIANELKRISSHADGIASIALRMIDAPHPRDGVALLVRMQEAVCRMLHQAVDAAFRNDEALARHIVLQDSSVDLLYAEQWLGIADASALAAGRIEILTQMLWVGHALERIGDRIRNICDRVVFVSTGELCDV